MASVPGRQPRRGARPIETAPIAADPINVSTTRRERFMTGFLASDGVFERELSLIRRRSDRSNAVISRHRARCFQLPLEKPNARAKEPKPPRVVVVVDEASDDDPLEPSPARRKPLPPLPPDDRADVQVPLPSAGAASPGELGSQLVRGIKA